MPKVFKSIAKYVRLYRLDTVYYSSRYTDVRTSEKNPLLHYLTIGRKEKRFRNAEHEKQRNEALKKQQILSKRPFFDETYYLEKYPDVKAAGMEAWEHYFLFGYDEGRFCNSTEDGKPPGEAFRLTLFRKGETTGGSKKQRILLVTHEMTVSGAPLSLKSVGKLLQAEGFEVEIWSFPVIVSEQVFDDLHCNIYEVPRNPKDCPAVSARLKEFDFVIANTVVCHTYAMLCYKHAVPHMWMIREAKKTAEYIQQLGISHDFFFRDRANIYCVSEYARQCISEITGTAPQVIHNFIEDRATEHSDLPEKRAFTLIGAITQNKGIHTCIEAFLQLNPAQADNWELNIIGPLNEAHRCYWEPLQELTLGYPNIIWHGMKTGDDKWELCRKTSVFIVPSYDESSSRVVLEAAMMGRPFIISRNVGAAYITADGAGASFNTCEADSLLQCIQEFLKLSQVELSKMGKAARRNYLATSTPAIYRDRILRIINQTIDRRCYAPICHAPEVREAAIPECDEIYTALVPRSSTLPTVPGSEIAVVIPVYNGLPFLKVLLPSLFAHTEIPHKFIFVDDCSDAAVAEWLKGTIQGRNDCLYVRNEKNAGFLLSATRGIDLAGECDFVILNTDTEVPAHWLRRLVAPLHSGRKIASVTPFSNCATIFSFPFMNNDAKNSRFLATEGLRAIDKAFASLEYSEIEIPTGHGFCMAISRAAWKEVGPFNLYLYGRGYGEEVDWSRRAMSAGWKHVMATNLFVAHHHKGSFSSDEKYTACKRAASIVNRLYPRYMDDVNDFINTRPQQAFIASALLALAEGSRETEHLLCNDDESLQRQLSQQKKAVRALITRRYSDKSERLFLQHPEGLWMFEQGATTFNTSPDYINTSF